ncbi:uncharacterized protein LOC134536997 [Bacillus rossius redtenbacheri]|uniref:uncharacterized protein LOC134536997 n=1 Tax=Bacillus rossius redtenbacheri TaxID=93214 RepID=UPI002FDD56F3
MAATRLLLLLWGGALCCVTAQTPEQVMVVPVGATVVMPCPSNDDDHIFQFWQLAAGDRVVGPTNLPSRDKYKFDAPSGTLYIRAVSTAEAGFYRCVAKNVDNKRLVVKAVELVVRSSPEDLEDSIFETSLFRGLVSVGAVLLLLLLGVLLFLLCRRRGASELAGAVDEESRGEATARRGTYNPTTVPVTSPQKPGASQGVDNPALETDFPRVFRALQRDDKA